MGAPKAIAQACTKIQGQFTSGASTFSQMAGAYALNESLSAPSEMKETFQHRRDLIVELLQQIPGIEANHPQGAFYIFPNISHYFGKSYDGQTIGNSEEFAAFLLQEAKVATVAGSAFGNDDCIRISYAASDEDIRTALQQIEKAVQLLQ